MVVFMLQDWSVSTFPLAMPRSLPSTSVLTLSLASSWVYSVFRNSASGGIRPKSNGIFLAIGTS